MTRRLTWFVVLAAALVAAGVALHRSGPVDSGRDTRVEAGPVQGALITAPLRDAPVAAALPAPPPAPGDVTPPSASNVPPPSAASPTAAVAVTPNEAGYVPAPVPVEGEALSVTFDQLASFEYAMPEEPMVDSPALIPGGSEQVPVEIKAYDQKVLGVKGFMLPLKVQNGLVTELLLMRDQSMCCYGVVPKITEWISVKMVGKGVKPIMDQPVTLFGRFQVGEVRENGYLVCLYRMEADRMVTSLDL